MTALRHASVAQANDLYTVKLWPVSDRDKLTPGFGNKAVARALLWLALLAMFLFMFGPFLDNHYAQLGPHHTHIFLGDAQLAHGHSHAPASAQRGDADFSSITGVFSLPSSGAAAGERSVQLVRTPIQLFGASAILFCLACGPFERLLANLLPPRERLFFPPPEAPPRFASISF